MTISDCLMNDGDAKCSRFLHVPSCSMQLRIKLQKTSTFENLLLFNIQGTLLKNLTKTNQVNNISKKLVPLLVLYRSNVFVLYATRC